MANFDVTDRKQLQAFLETVSEREGGRSRVVAFSARSALRVVPFFTQLDFAETSTHQSDIILPSLRAIAVSWVAGAYPTHDTALSALSADSAAHSARSAALSALSARSAARSARSADSAAHSARSAALSAHSAALSARSAALSALSADSAADSAAHSAHSAARSALNTDVDNLDTGQILSGQALWSATIPDAMVEDWKALSEKLLDLDAGWEVWTDWYEARVRGGPTHPELSPAANERIEVARVLEIEDDDWNQGAAHVNAKIKAIIERETARDLSERERQADEATESPSFPPEPDVGPGPDYSAPDGKLRRRGSAPHGDDEAASARLLPKLTATAERLVGLALSLDNTHPELAFAVREYAEEISRPFEELDIPGLFATGGALVEMHIAFEQPADGKMTTQLEPEVNGLLASVARQHGAFLLGTQDGRELVERADRFLQQAELLREIESPGNVLLGVLTDDPELVDEPTRRAHKPLRDLLLNFDWTVGRTGYAAMVSVRKAVFVCLKVIVWSGGIAGGAAALSTVAGDPQMQFLSVAVPFVRDHAAQILAFYKHSPELRAYAEYALGLIETADESGSPGQARG